MIHYYILFPKDTEADCEKETNQLGTIFNRRNYVTKHSFHGEFWFKPEKGYKIFEYLINQKPELVPHLRIINSKGRRISVEEFVEHISECKMENN